MTVREKSGVTAITRSLGVITALRDQLLRGDFAPDERLQEMALAERLQVSRTPIREALRTLAEEGLLVYEPNRGYRVRRFSLDYILKAFRLRMALEGLSARLAAERPLTEAVDSEFSAVLARGDALLLTLDTGKFDVEQWRDMNKAFHFVIHRHADNELLMQTARWSTRIPVVIQGAFRWYSSADYRRSHEEHHRLYDAIRRGQPDRADHIMQEHIYMAMEMTRRHYPELFPEGGK